MNTQRPQRTPQKENNLVADQPGLAILGAGILISVLFGFAIRGVVHPSQIQTLVAEAATKIDKDIQVQFESADLSLAHGFWPRISIIIHNIQMRSESSCWMKPTLDIDELELPLSLWSYLTLGNPVTRIEAQTVRLRLAGEKRDCSEKAKKENAEVAIPTSQAVVLVHKDEKKTSTTPALDRVLIRHLEIDPLHFPLAHTQLSKVELSVKSHQPQILTLKAQSDILKDPLWGDYSAHALLSVEYSEFPEKNIEMHVSGNWREGSFSWHTSYKLSEGFFVTEAEVRHIPLSKLGSISSRWGLNRLEPLKQVWVSLKLKSQGLSESLQKSPVNIRDFKIEGDSGDLLVEKLEWLHIEDSAPQPFMAQMRGLPLEMLLKMGIQSQSSPILKNIGFFTGRADVEDLNNLRVLGELEGLQFVFSNKGQREYQTIRRMSLDLKRTRGQWALDVSRIEPEQGVFNGELTASADKDLNDIKIKLFAEEFSLSPAVQKLMSGGGSLGSFQSKIELGFYKGKLDRLQGKLQGQNVEIENIKIPKFSMQLQNEGWDKFQVALQIPQQSVDSEIVEKSFLNPLADLIPREELNFELKNFKSVLVLKDFNTVKWKQLSFGFPQGNLSGAFEWNVDGELAGQLLLKNHQGAHRFLIEGSRDQPVLTQVRETSN
jgi:hypothetical protein